MVTGFDNTVVGKQTLIVTYKSFTDTFDVEIIAKSLTSIEVTTAPTKVEYLEAKDTLDVSNGKVTLYYNNDTNEVIDLTAAMVTGFDNTVVGKQTLTVTYKSFTDTFDVEIIAKSLVSIEVTKLPTKDHYLVQKDTLDVTGGKITLYYDNDTSEEIDLTAQMVTGFDNEIVGILTLTVTFNEKTAEFDVVIIDKTLMSVAVTNVPSDTEYHQHRDALDVTDGKVTLYYDNDTQLEMDMSVAMVSGYDNTKAGKQTLTVTVNAKTSTFDVLVTEHEFSQKHNAQEHWQECDICQYKVDTSKHVYDNSCDTDCNSCGDERTITHKYGKYISNKDATCCKDGTKSAICSVCNEKDTVVDKGSALGHGDTTKVFKDVGNKWYLEAINYNYTHKFVSGMSATEFGVSTNVTRGMFITILARIAGVDTANKNVTTRFSDVPSGKYYTNAIKWASENKIVNGITETTFEPDTYIQRQQLCVMIVNFAKHQNIELTVVEPAINFTDASTIGNYAKSAVAACQMADVVNGYGNSIGYEFKPKNTATRAEAAQILYKFHSEFMTSK